MRAPVARLTLQQSNAFRETPRRSVRLPEGVVIDGQIGVRIHFHSIRIGCEICSGRCCECRPWEESDRRAELDTFLRTSPATRSTASLLMSR
jgi:hypothetical protein